jgi:hypothetical protein
MTSSLETARTPTSVRLPRTDTSSERWRIVVRLVSCVSLHPPAPAGAACRLVAASSPPSEPRVAAVPPSRPPAPLRWLAPAEPDCAPQRAGHLADQKTDPL